MFVSILRPTAIRNWFDRRNKDAELNDTPTVNICVMATAT
jgi:hypothetical protein